jgi:3-isopropylmalate/(R)-2-methylmalate dehydratase small subunit
MTRFNQLTGIAAVLPENNIDTDVIYPGRFLTRLSKQSMAECLFFDRRFDNQGNEKAEFVLNQTNFKKSQIIIAGANFGCGSSRETAVWALADFGIRCIIAPSFGEIFYTNCFNNMMLPIVLPLLESKRLLLSASQAEPITIDLAYQRIVLADGTDITFDISSGNKEMLMTGLDEISRQLSVDIDDICTFENRQKLMEPWLWG